ncbi:putative beta-1,3-galactosyltransferase 1-like [Apostichopus japonicus]|uniref:Hexosyltransferase n=1 Tax=Stichopus japonicus TaxID=307972 RepID=A0A2G8K485_STIJA|nr:putative beta-1,3-galactosyltransferase 1-like [Apostichopus japonicus]
MVLRRKWFILLIPISALVATFSFTTLQHPLSNVIRTIYVDRGSSAFYVSHVTNTRPNNSKGLQTGEQQKHPFDKDENGNSTKLPFQFNQSIPYFPFAPAMKAANNNRNFGIIHRPADFRFDKGNHDGPYLLVLMLSRASSITQRNAQRESCLSVKVARGRNVRSVFLLGKPKEEKLLADIKAEQEQYQDILMEDFDDTYNNLTLKVLMGMKWASEYCNNASWVMKVDDDVYVDLAQLVEILEGLTTTVKTMIGWRIHKAKPVRDTNHKWFVSKEQYIAPVYPDYLCGIGYVISGDLPRLFYEESMSLPYFFLEDVFMGILAKRIGVTMHHSRKFETKHKKYVKSSKSDAVAVHLSKPHLVTSFFKAKQGG